METWPSGVPQDPRHPSVMFPPGVRAWAPGEGLRVWLETHESGGRDDVA